MPESISLRFMKKVWAIGKFQISAQLKIPISTIDDTIRRFKSCQSTAIGRPRSGRPCKITDRAARNIVRKVKKDPGLTLSELQKDLEAAGTKVCKNTIKKVLIGEGFNSRTPRKTPLLRHIGVKNRLQFAKDHLDKPAKFWDSVLWSDEKIESFGRNSVSRVWRRKGPAYDLKNTITTEKFGGRSIMVWGCFSSAVNGKLHIIEGKVNGAMNSCCL